MSLSALIVDDHPIVRTGLAALLTRETGVVTLAATINEAEAALRRIAFDLLLLDLDFGTADRNGFDFLPVARQLQPSLGIIIVSVYGDESLMARARALGASGFVTKSVPEAELLTAVNAVVRGGQHFGTPTARHPEFSTGELAVIRLLAADRSRKQIAATMGISVGMVDLHLPAIGTKLGVRGLPALRAEIARRALHLLAGSPPPPTPLRC